jgi:hypothetical protein
MAQRTTKSRRIWEVAGVLHDGPGRNRVPAIQADAGNLADSKTMAWVYTVHGHGLGEKGRQRERERQLDRRQSGSQSCNLQRRAWSMEQHGAWSMEHPASRQVERARERDCVFVFTALLERTVRAVRHASPDFPFPVARATRPFRFAALDLVSTTTSGRARAPADTQTHRHSHVSPGCRPRLPFAAAAARRAACDCDCDCDCDSSGPHFDHASTLLACLARVVGPPPTVDGRRSTVDCIVGMQPRPIEPAASLHGGMAASLHRCIHPSVRPRTTVAWLAFVDQRATEAMGIVHASTTWTAPCLSGYWPDQA